MTIEPRDVEISPEKLMEQASMTANDYLREAVERIDSLLGEGYAEKHPELVGAFMQTAAADFLAASIQIAGQKVRDGLYDAHQVK